MSFLDKTKLTANPGTTGQKIILVQVDPYYGDTPVFLQNNSDPTSFLVAGSNSSAANSGQWTQVSAPEFVMSNQEFLAAYQNAGEKRRSNVAYSIERVRIPVPYSNPVQSNSPSTSYRGANTTQTQMEASNQYQQQYAAYNMPQQAGFDSVVLILGMGALAGIALLARSMRKKENSESLGAIPIAN